MTHQVHPANNDNPEHLASPEVFFGTLLTTFQSACTQSGGAVEHFMNLGEYTVRLSFAGPALVSLFTRALRHLFIEPVQDPSFTVCFWDSTSTGTTMPRPPWPNEAYGVQGEIQGYNTDRIRTVFQPGVNALHMLHHGRSLAFYWVAAPEQVPYWEASFPMRTILHWWLADKPYQPIHSAAVGRPEGGVLIAGKSGSGKSTSTMACLSSDLLYLGDDYVLVRTDAEPAVHSLYSTAKLDAEAMERFPSLRHTISNPTSLDTEKALIFVHEFFPEKFVRAFPLKAILVPVITGLKDTLLKPANPGASLMAIAPTTVFHLQGASRELFQKLSRLVKQVPSYTLELGTDLTQIPEAISSVLNGDLP
jgi:hypothetical protein